MRRLIRTDGTAEDLPAPLSIVQIGTLIGAPQACDTIMMKHMGHPRHVMVVDDTGMVDHKPVNHEATQLYWKNCKGPQPGPIHGDVVVVPDGDFR